MELFMKKILYLLFFLSLNSFCASDAGSYELTLLSDEDLAELGILNLPPDSVTGLDLQANVSDETIPLEALHERDVDLSVFGLEAPVIFLPESSGSSIALAPIMDEKENEQSAPGPIRRPRSTRRNTRRILIEDASSGEEEIAEEQTESDDDYNRNKVASFKKKKSKRKLQPKIHECKDCKKRFSRKPDRDKHFRRRHLGQLAEPCLECGEYFVDKSDLAKHSKVCTGEATNEIISCPYPGCKNVYKNETFLQAHIARDHAQPAASTE